MFVKLLLVCCLVGMGLSYPMTRLDEGQLKEEEWTLYKKTYNKQYKEGTEERLRRLIWLENVVEIEAHNRRANMGEFSYWLGINQFTDLTMKEMKAYKGYGGYEGPVRNTNTPPPRKFKDPENLPNSFDWRTKGAVTPVKNQGQCGSCWAFSTIGAIEGQQFLRSKKLVSLSEQNLVDCSVGDGNGGCNGGWPYRAYVYGRMSRGIDTEESYPYEAKNNKCRYKGDRSGALIYGFDSVPDGSEDDLKVAVAQYGPMSVCIDAAHKEFSSYKSGVLDVPSCKSHASDHCVLVVGYGTESGKDYWLVKNSWGETWGENGYIKMARNKQNQCGIATDASWPLL